METKTYFANNVPSALEVARRELGAEALLLNSRPAPDDMRQFGRLEVTFAWDPAAAERLPEWAKTRLSTAPPAENVTQKSSELEDIRLQLTALRRALGRVPGQGMEPEEDPRAAAIEAKLAEAGLSSELARELAEAACRESDAKAALENELTRRIPAAPFADIRQGESRALAFLGPPGRGKTSTLVKVAIRMGLARRVPVRIYSAGAHGVGGREQIARYAAILGVPQQSFESLDSLGLALNGDAWKGLILIDTPGLSPADHEEMRAFAGFLAVRPEIERHLVLRADTRCAEMLATVKRFAPVQPTQLLFTGLDESRSAGAMAETLIRSGIPATFAGTGANIPEDLIELEAAQLAGRVREALEPAPATRPAVRAARAAA
jgi:flagellar biosynthesis protein FlhF